MTSFRSNLSQTPYASHSDWYVASMERLVLVVQELSHARTLDEIMQVVRIAARELTAADGATFVLKDGDQCHYAEENAVGPLWKGRKFPLSTCISGWAMLHAQAAVIPDIYVDPRIPHDAYRPTFVKSLVMVPIRRAAPIGAIGNYWANSHEATGEEVAVLQALADATSLAMENVELYSRLEKKIVELEQSNNDLRCFAWAASHDLQEPLRTITTQIEMLERDMDGKLTDRDRDRIHGTIESAGRLRHLVQNLLAHAQAEKTDSFQSVYLGPLIEDVKRDLDAMIQESAAQIETVGVMPCVHGDPHLLECLFQNLLSNAIKFRSPGKAPHVRIEAYDTGDECVISITDNGVGIPEEHHQQVFGLFERLHVQDRYPGAGIGLATCRKIVDAHGGRIWVESETGGGSHFWLALPKEAM